MAKNNKTRFFYVLYSDKTRVFDQSERAYYPIYIIISDITMETFIIDEYNLHNIPYSTAVLRPPVGYYN